MRRTVPARLERGAHDEHDEHDEQDAEDKS